MVLSVKRLSAGTKRLGRSYRGGDIHRAASFRRTVKNLFLRYFPAEHGRHINRLKPSDIHSKMEINSSVTSLEAYVLEFMSFVYVRTMARVRGTGAVMTSMDNKQMGCGTLEYTDG